jgi:uncharacterized protein (TIGR03032 family)
MKLAAEFYRLPLRFDARHLSDEVGQFGEAEWRPHPQGHPGNSALPLLASGGDPTNEDTRGPMRPTAYLERCSYIRQVLGTLAAPIGRTRLMRIAGRGEATAHVDTNYYWAQRVRVHIPVLTYPGVRFCCGDREVFMDAGECWIFDTWRNHNVLNPDDRPRIHLVVDTVGSEAFWKLVAQAEQPFDTSRPAPTPRFVPYLAKQPASCTTESHNFPVVMSPWEVGWVIDQIIGDLAGESPRAARLRARLGSFLQQWSALWSQFGAALAGWESFRAALGALDGDLADLRGDLRLTNGVEATDALQHWLVRAALNPDLAGAPGPPPMPARANPAPPAAPPHSSTRFDRPIFIVAAPRSGSTLLFETLARAAEVYTIGGESHAIIENIAELAPAAQGYQSNRLAAADATPQIVARLQAALLGQLRDRDGRPPADAAPLRLLEKTPKNALRIPFLAAAFPDARFIYLYREPHENIASIIEAWRSGKFVTYPNLPGWHGPPWSLLLIPGWQALHGHTPAEVAAAQWSTANRQILDDLAALPHDRWIGLSYTALLADPQRAIERLCRFSGLTWDQQLGGALPLARHTLTPPNPDKWRQHAPAIEPLLPSLRGLAERAQAMLADDKLPAAAPMPGPDGAVREPLRSIHTTSFPQLLRELGLALFVSTYQAGKLVILRASSELLNTHFRSFNKPMGLALHGQRLAIGTATEIRDFHNLPAVAGRLPGAETCDACFLPRGIHTTGDIQIHEMAWAAGELWFVNTRFSCLCTQHPDYSFVPRWRPPFISALAPEDRCHLNGMAIVDGRPRYATALGQSDERQGWRAHKHDGGILLDIEANAVMLRGLAMPHSPRWHAGRLWVLDSGNGGLGVVDPASGRYEEVVRLPGFTRGLDFYDRYAFVGLSQVRESALFNGIAVAELPIEQRACGVWVIDIVSGKPAAFVKFEDQVQEIFAVQVAPGLHFPDVINEEQTLIAGAFMVPDTMLDLVPSNLTATTKESSTWPASSASATGAGSQ